MTGKRGKGRSIASLAEIHKGHHGLLRPMKGKGWCLYWSSCYLPLTIAPSYDCTCTHYIIEGASWHFSENNTNESGLSPKVTGKIEGELYFRALCIVLWLSADQGSQKLPDLSIFPEARLILPARYVRHVFFNFFYEKIQNWRLLSFRQYEKVLCSSRWQKVFDNGQPEFLFWNYH